jgi:hypothetical protein
MTVANRYVTGNLVRLWVSFRNEVDAPQDPTTVTLRVQDPSGQVSVYETLELTKTSVGEWEYRLPAELEGDYSYRWEGTGALTAAEEGMFVAETRLD